jgi:hypothetical protein
MVERSMRWMDQSGAMEEGGQEGRKVQGGRSGKCSS